MKHTPIPYRIIDSCTNEPAIEAHQPYGMANFIICPEVKGDCYGEVTALENAQFIMLNALKALVDCQRESTPEAFNMRFDRAVQYARNIIDRVEKC
jgi:hypothetical protein